ncbi:MAG: peptidoglycan DD-metalloendopeptidase family protein [Candidatus Caldatribacteriota bacterium]|nr:peptidoglycan DD-metalloendopeptidase family protein [Candidatus Caldatribacteriota bacterium]
MYKKSLVLKRNKKVIFVVILILTFFLCISFYVFGNSEDLSQKVKDENQRLKKIEEQIKKVKNEISNLQTKESNYLGTLHKIEKLSAGTKKELQEIEKDLKFAQEEIKEAEEEYFLSKRELKEKTKIIENRLREIYKHRRTNYLEILFNSKNFSDFLSRYKYIKDIISLDIKIINDIRNKIKLTEDRRISLENRKEILILLKKEVEKEKENIEYSIKAKKSIIHKIDTQKDAHLKSLEELKQSSEEIKKLIEKIYKEQKKSKKIVDAGPALKAKKGILALPIQGKIISNFGRQKNPDFNTYTFNSGIDISAPMGEVIRSAGSGKVIYTGWVKGYGQIIIIDHGGRISTLYAHLFKTLINSGDKVKKGQIIGQAGDSGGVSSPRLHFEVRSEGKPTDPMNWL